MVTHKVENKIRFCDLFVVFYFLAQVILTLLLRDFAVKVVNVLKCYLKIFIPYAQTYFINHEYNNPLLLPIGFC